MKQAQWLRHRIWQLTDGKLTIAVRAGDLDGARLLVLTTHEAIEPIRFDGKIKWRVNDNCVEVDPTSWHSGKLSRTGIDWSAQPSGHMMEKASPVAVAIARRYLQAAGDESSLDLAAARIPTCCAASAWRPGTGGLPMPARSCSSGHRRWASTTYAATSPAATARTASEAGGP
jgi:hypothetical protein